MRYLLPAILLLGTQIASAQSILKDKDDKELSVLLNEVVITGTGTEHYLKDAPVQTEVITSKALEQYQARSIDDLLSGLSPSLTFHDGDMGSHIQLNGLNNDYILIMINGKRMNGDVGGQNDLNQLNPANIERIEIVKGAASSLYGSDAIAGVINIITKRNREKMELTNTSRIGEYGDIRQSTSFGFNYGKIKSVTGINFRHTDGWRNTDLQWDQNQLKSGSTMLTVNRSSNYTLSENIEWQVNRKLDLTAEGTYYERWVMRTHGPWKYQANDFYYRNYTFAVGSKYKLGKRNYLTADLSYGRYGYFYDYKLNEHTDYFLDNDRHERITYFAGQRIKQSIQKQILGQVKSVFYLGEDHILNAGIEYQYNHLESPHHIDGDRASVYTLAAYIQEEWTARENLVLTAGVRGTQHKETGLNFSPKISGLYKPGEHINLRASYALGYKAPTIKELYYNYTGVIGGGALTAYHGNTELKAQTSQYALDFTFNYRPAKSLSLAGGYSYADPKAQYPNKGIDYMKYLPIDATSSHNANLNILWQHSWKLYRLGIGIYGRYQSTRRYINDNNADGFQTWRINTAHSLLKMKRWSLTMNAGVDNVFDYVDRTPFGRNRATSTPGRTFYVSALIKFKNN